MTVSCSVCVTAARDRERDRRANWADVLALPGLLDRVPARPGRGQSERRRSGSGRG
jgi:hypothetical protein